MPQAAWGGSPRVVLRRAGDEGYEHDDDRYASGEEPTVEGSRHSPSSEHWAAREDDDFQADDGRGLGIRLDAAEVLGEPSQEVLHLHRSRRRRRRHEGKEALDAAADYPDGDDDGFDGDLPNKRHETSRLTLPLPAPLPELPPSARASATALKRWLESRGPLAGPVPRNALKTVVVVRRRKRSSDSKPESAPVLLRLPLKLKEAKRDAREAGSASPAQGDLRAQASLLSALPPPPAARSLPPPPLAPAARSLPAPPPAPVSPGLAPAPRPSTLARTTVLPLPRRKPAADSPPPSAKRRRVFEGSQDGGADHDPHADASSTQSADGTGADEGDLPKGRKVVRTRRIVNIVRRRVKVRRSTAAADDQSGSARYALPEPPRNAVRNSLATPDVPAAPIQIWRPATNRVPLPRPQYRGTMPRNALALGALPPPPPMPAPQASEAPGAAEQPEPVRLVARLIARSGKVSGSGKATSAVVAAAPAERTLPATAIGIAKRALDAAVAPAAAAAAAAMAQQDAPPIILKPWPEALVAKASQSAALRSRHAGAAALRRGGELAVFEVGKRTFKVPVSLLRAHPSTRLARLVAEYGGKGETATQVVGEPLCVNVDEQRFSYILDWYRYGEISLPPATPVSGLLRDARLLLLPQDIIINGSLRSTQQLAGIDVAKSLVDLVVERWAGFQEYFIRLLDEISAHFQGVAQQSVGVDEPCEFQPFVLPILGDAGWADVKNVCSPARARVLALRLEEVGYWCLFSEVDLVVRWQ